MTWHTVLLTNFSHLHSAVSISDKHIPWMSSKLTTLWPWHWSKDQDNYARVIMFCKLILCFGVVVIIIVNVIMSPLSAMFGCDLYFCCDPALVFELASGVFVTSRIVFPLFAESVKKSIRRTAAEFMKHIPMFSQRLAQRDYEMILVPPHKKRLLLKMYILGENRFWQVTNVPS